MRGIQDKERFIYLLLYFFLLKSIKEYGTKMTFDLGLVKWQGKNIPGVTRVAHDLANSRCLINIC